MLEQAPIETPVRDVDETLSADKAIDVAMADPIEATAEPATMSPLEESAEDSEPPRNKA